MLNTIKKVSEHRCFNGVQGTYSHTSTITGTDMQFAVYVPPQAEQGPLPVLWYLSGLTCTEENVMVKAGAQRYAAEHGLIFVAPDTSPRGANIPGEEDDYDFGLGASFYVNATEPPWRNHYNMYSYIVHELPEIIFKHFPADVTRQGITGHSMGGHGALVIGLNNTQQYQSISAFAPICAPTHCDWGRKAFAGYLGDDPEAWRAYDASELVRDGKHSGLILIDQGDQDTFLKTQLKPELFYAACKEAKQSLKFRMQEGYDHSYFFVASFIEEHIEFHATRLYSNE